MSLKEVLKQVLPAGARERVYSVELVHRRWAEAVGHELARRSEPEALSEGVLTVRVTDPVWGKMIHELQDRIIPALNRAMGSTLVRRINFTRKSQLERAPQGAAQKARERDTAALPESLVAAASGIEDAELRELVLRSAAHYLGAQSNDPRRKKQKETIP